MEQSSYCRLCALFQPKHLLLKFNPKEIAKEFIQLRLNKLNVNVDLKSEHLPNSVCFKCVNAVTAAYDFVIAIEKAQIFLNKEFLPPEIKEEEAVDEEVVNSVTEMDDTHSVKSEIEEELPETVEEAIEPPTQHKKLFGTNNPMSNLIFISSTTIEKSLKLHGAALRPNSNFQFIHTGESSKTVKNSDEEVINLYDSDLELDDTDPVKIEEELPEKSDGTIKPPTLKNLLETNTPMSNLINTTIEKSLNLNGAALRPNPNFQLVNTGESSKTSNSVIISVPDNVNAAKNTISIQKLREQLKKDGSILNETQAGKRKRNKTRVYNSDLTEWHKQSIAAWHDFRWVCVHCGTHFTTNAELTEHSIQYHKHCNPFSCLDCNRRSTELQTFIKHAVRHNYLLGNICHLCHFEFWKNKSSRTHNCPYDRFPYKCKGCGSQFVTEEKLNEHTEAYFKQRGPTNALLSNCDFDNLSCKVCNKRFNAKRHLVVHMEVHKERKREYVCETCGKSFYSITCLSDHMIAHEKRRPYLCEVCKQAFKTKAQLKLHVVRHGEKRFACDKCVYRCFFKKELTQHEKIHSDTMSYICDYCEKSFRSKYRLISHLLQHTGEKPFSCQVCEKKFTNWGNRHGHMLRMHNLDLRKKKDLERKADMEWFKKKYAGRKKRITYKSKTDLIQPPQ